PAVEQVEDERLHALALEGDEEVERERQVGVAELLELVEDRRLVSLAAQLGDGARGLEADDAVLVPDELLHVRERVALLELGEDPRGPAARGGVPVAQQRAERGRAAVGQRERRGHGRPRRRLVPQVALLERAQV